jgi:hypothetical protein
VLQLLSFGAYWSSPYDLIIKVWNFGNFLNKILKFQILENTDLTKIIRKLGFRVLMCSNKICILVIVKKLRTENFEIF